MTRLETDSDVPTPSDPEEPPVVRRDRSRRRGGDGRRTGAEAAGATDSGGSRRRTDRDRATIVHPARMWPYVVVSVVCVGVLVTLAWEGYQTSLDIRGGVESKVTDPSKPGYEAQVQPTPTHLLISTTPGGKVGDAYLVVEGNGGSGGTVLFIPGLVVVRVDGEPFNLADLADRKGIGAVVDAIQRTLGIGVTNAVEVSPDVLKRLVEPAGALAVQNPDALGGSGSGGGTTFPAGDIEVRPDQVAEYLSILDVGESIVDRPVRAAELWESWISRLATDRAAVPSDVTAPSIADGDPVDVASIIGGLAKGQVSYQQLPVDRLEVPNSGGFAVYQPDAAGIADSISRIVPFPTSAFAGQRTRVRLLRGTTDEHATLRAAQPLVAAGGEILVLGNASSFRVATTRVEYNAPGQKSVAQEMAKRLGVGEATAGSESDAVDVTVIIGADFTG
jgi:hypothetical protein